MKIYTKQSNIVKKAISLTVALAFFWTNILTPSYAQNAFTLPAPGTMITLSPAFVPPMLQGIKIFSNNPLRFDFILDTGNSTLQDEGLQEESSKLIKYFMVALTVPDSDLWVNLSPYEKDRIIPEQFGSTEMGRDLLAQDYILKQLTASLIYPEKELGKKFWDKIYRKAREQYGTTEMPVNTFNKVWIVPEKAIVYEHGNSAFVVKSRLRVMLDSDYLAMNQGIGDRSEER